ncbi:MAG: glycosyltransferase [Candidatus Levybacteria bacterium]|nr:glycosyltransferase [Candidatus Levybacteria bacterium]
MKKPKVSIVILNWNGREHLKKCLLSISKVSYSPIEIIVVDNGSLDGSGEMVKKDFPQVILVLNNKNLGYSGGNNVGIKKSTGDYVFILNNDTEVTRDFLDPLVSAMERDASLGCVQPKLLYASDRMLLNAVGSYFTSTGFLYHYGYRKKADLKQYNVPLTIYSAKGAAMLLRKSALKKVGLLDEDFFIFFEETDLCHRLWLAGYKIVYIPDSIIYHHEAVDTSKQMEDYTRNYLSFRNRICSFIKNLEVINMVKIFTFLFAIYLFLLIFYLINLRWYLVKAIAMGIIWNVINLSATLEKRHVIQKSVRRISDNKLFEIIKKNPPFVYYYYLFTTLKNFKNENFLLENTYPKVEEKFIPN